MSIRRIFNLEYKMKKQMVQELNTRYFSWSSVASLLLLLSWMGLSIDLQAQEVITPRQKASPLAMATFLDENGTYLKVTYGQPYRKDRVIFGGLVPYDEVWRTGANEATELTLTQDVRINGKYLNAGTYTLFTIPNKEQWQLILNAQLGQWGAYKYEEFKDQNVLTTPIESERVEDIYEAFTIQFEETKQGANLILLWDQVKAIVPIEFIRS